MGTLKNAVYFFFFSLLLSACEEEAPLQVFKPRFKELAECKYAVCIEPLVIPDSIDKNLIAVTYYEYDPRICHSLIVYNDLFKNTATCIKLFADSGIFRDKLKVISYNEFRSLSDTCNTYLIKDSSVAYVHRASSCAVDWEYRRTDNLPPPSLLKE